MTHEDRERKFHRMEVQLQQHEDGTRIMSRSALKRIQRDLQNMRTDNAKLHIELWDARVAEQQDNMTAFWHSGDSAER